MKNKFKILSIVLTLILISACMEPAKKLGLTYGAFIRQNGIEFRLCAPSSEDINLVIFSNAEDESGKEFPMVKNENGDWRLFLENIGVGTLYGYRLTGPYNDENVIIADPYSKAAVTQNT